MSFACAIFPKVSPDFTVYSGVVVVASAFFSGLKLPSGCCLKIVPSLETVYAPLSSVLAVVAVASFGAPANLLSILSNKDNIYCFLFQASGFVLNKNMIFEFLR